MSDCINIVKLTIKNNKKGFIIIKNKTNLAVLTELLKLNVLNYIVIKDNYIIANINYLNEKPVYSNIINFFKPSNKKYISLRNLKKISDKNNWIFILSTSKGIINSVDAIKLNLGGLIIAQLWN